jgi:peptide deformylase
MSNIRQQGDPVLHTKAALVPHADITSERIQTIIKDMHTTLAKEPDGAALAAPQIGVSLRIFVLAPNVFGPDSNHPDASKDPHMVFINPVITKLSRQKHKVDEGCLSLRGKYGNTIRHTRATIEAYDEHGKKFTRGASGLLAQAFQHECDHLDGTLFCEHAMDMWEVDMNTPHRQP